MLPETGTLCTPAGASPKAAGTGPRPPRPSGTKPEGEGAKGKPYPGEAAPGENASIGGSGGIKFPGGEGASPPKPAGTKPKGTTGTAPADSAGLAGISP